MKVTAWNNGSHHSNGAGYGFKVRTEDRDKHFDRTWENVEVELPNGDVVEAKIEKDSFWNTKCRELINKEFGKWLIHKSFAPWENGKPPNFELVHVANNRFRLSDT